MTPQERIKAYEAAFVAANPGNPPPIIRYEHGWYRFQHGSYSSYAAPYRAKKVDEMTDRLRARAALARTDEEPEGGQP